MEVSGCVPVSFCTSFGTTYLSICLYLRLEGIATRVEGIATRLEAIATRVEAIATRVEGIAIRLEGIAIRLEGIAIRLEGIAIRLEGIAYIYIYLSLSLSPSLTNKGDSRPSHAFPQSPVASRSLAPFPGLDGGIVCSAPPNLNGSGDEQTLARGASRISP